MARRRWGGWVSARMLRALGRGARVHAAAAVRRHHLFSAFARAGWFPEGEAPFASGIAAFFRPALLLRRNTSSSSFILIRGENTERHNAYTTLTVGQIRQTDASGNKNFQLSRNRTPKKKGKRTRCAHHFSLGETVALLFGEDGYTTGTTLARGRIPAPAHLRRSRPHLGRISAASRLHLGCISAQALRGARAASSRA